MSRANTWRMLTEVINLEPISHLPDNSLVNETRGRSCPLQLRVVVSGVAQVISGTLPISTTGICDNDLVDESG
jgi:hypothetical protein